MFLTWQPRKNTVGVKMTSRISFLSFLVVCRTIRRFIIPPTPTPRVFELLKIGSFSFRFRFSFYAICSRNVPCTLGLLHVKIKTHVFFSAVFTLQLYITHPGKAHTPHPERAFWSNPKVSESVFACIVHDRMSYLVDSAWHITLWYAHMRHKIKLRTNVRTFQNCS